MIIAVILFVIIAIILLVLYTRLLVYINYRDGRVLLAAGVFGYQPKALKYTARFATINKKPHIRLQNQHSGKKILVPIVKDKNQETPKKKKGKNKLIGSVFKAMHAEKLYIELIIGTDDAANTALVCGCVNVLLLTLTAMQRSHKTKVNVSVLPDFNKPCFKGKASCIFSLRIADIIYEIIKHKRKEV